MLLRLLILSLLPFSILQTNAQSLDPFVVASSGDSNLTSESSLSWTVGEFAIMTLEHSDCMLTQGFHQANYNSVFINTTELTELSIEVFPNPTFDKIQITTSSEMKRYSLEVFNVQGQLILEKNDIKLPYSISLTDWFVGSYFVKIFEPNDRRRGTTYNIIKQ